MSSIKYYLLIILLAFLSACSVDDEDMNPTPSEESIALEGEATYPEGIAIHPTSGELYITGFGDGSVQKIATDHSTSYLLTPGNNGNFQNVGIELDITRNRMWVCQIDFTTGISQVSIYTLDGDLQKRLEVPDTQFPHFLNDVIIDEDGNAYITDSFGPQIWTVPSDLSEMSIWVSDNRFVNSFDFFNLNGLTFSPDNQYIITTSNDVNGEGDLFRIDIAKQEVVAVEVDASVFSDFFFGGDGIVFQSTNELLLFSDFQGVTRAVFNADYTSCVVNKADFETDVFSPYSADFPTTGKIYEDHLYLVLGQLDHVVEGLDPNEFGTAPNPFYLLKTPLALIQ